LTHILSSFPTRQDRAACLLMRESFFPQVGRLAVSLLCVVFQCNHSKQGLVYAVVFPSWIAFQIIYVSISSSSPHCILLTQFKSIRISLLSSPCLHCARFDAIFNIVLNDTSAITVFTQNCSFECQNRAFTKGIDFICKPFE